MKKKKERIALENNPFIYLELSQFNVWKNRERKREREKKDHIL